MVFSTWQDTKPNRSPFIGSRFRSAITENTALWGPHIGSDLYLLKIHFKVKKKKKTGNKYNEKRKMMNIFKIQSGNKNML
jgi:hypothetical protein